MLYHIAARLAHVLGESISAQPIMGTKDPVDEAPFALASDGRLRFIATRCDGGDGASRFERQTSSAYFDAPFFN